MSDFFKFIWNDIILWMWQLPQHIIAGIMVLVNWKSIETHEAYGITYFTAKHVYDCAVSLGRYIFLDSDTYGNDKYKSYLYNTVHHEYGHTRQSKYLGWFYLIFIGLPSVIGNLVDRILNGTDKTHRDHCHYYDQPWEHWADKLGGVNRKERKSL